MWGWTSILLLLVYPPISTKRKTKMISLEIIFEDATLTSKIRTGLSKWIARSRTEEHSFFIFPTFGSKEGSPKKWANGWIALSVFLFKPAQRTRLLFT